MVRSVVLLGLAAAAEAFIPAGMPALRAPGTGLRAQVSARRATFVAPKMQGGDGNVVWDAGSDWKSESQKQQDATSGMQMRGMDGNVDTPDFFEDEDGNVNQGAGGTGFNSGAAATGGDQKSKLQSMLSADKTEIRAAEKYQSNTEVKFVAHKWKIDGDFASGDPTFDLKWSAAFGNAQSSFEIEPNSMTFEDFVAGFTDDTPPGWSVEPKSGTLDRRGGKSQEFTVTYGGMGAPSGPTPGTLVVVLPNDNFSWTYKFQVSPP